MFSEKQAAVVPDEVFDAAADQGVATVNFSKNQLTAIPPRYTHIIGYVMVWYVILYHIILYYIKLSPLSLSCHHVNSPNINQKKG